MTHVFSIRRVTEGSSQKPKKRIPPPIKKIPIERGSETPKSSFKRISDLYATNDSIYKT